MCVVRLEFRGDETEVDGVTPMCAWCCTIERENATWRLALMELEETGVTRGRSPGHSTKRAPVAKHPKPTRLGHDFLSWSSGVFQWAAWDRRLKNGTAWAMVGNLFGVLESWM